MLGTQPAAVHLYVDPDVALLPIFPHLHTQARASIPERYRLVPRAGAKVVGERLPGHRVNRVHVPPEGLAAPLTYHVPKSCGVVPGEIQYVYTTNTSTSGNSREA